MSTIIDGTTGITTDGLITTGITTNGLIITGPSLVQLIKLETSKATTSGTSIDFTGIPSWVRRITVMFSGVSTNGTSAVQVQLGSGSFSTTGYASQVQQGASATTSTTGLIVVAVVAASVVSGSVQVGFLGSNTWVESGNLTTGGSVFNSAGTSPALSGTLDRIRITTVNGTDTFDAGSVNILIEGSL